MTPPDSPLMLALRSVDADLSRIDARIAPLADELAQLKRDRKAAEGKKAEIVDALLGKTSYQPPLIAEPEPEPPPAVVPTPPPAGTVFGDPGEFAGLIPPGDGPAATPTRFAQADADGNLGGWRSRPVADLDLHDHIAGFLRRAGVATIGQLADALRANRPLGLARATEDQLRIDVNDVAADDPDFEPLEPPAPPRPGRSSAPRSARSR